MRWKKTVFLFLLLLLTAEFYYFKVRPKSSTPSFSSLSHDAAHVRVLPLEPKETIKRIVLKDHLKNTEISVKQVSDHVWKVESPVQYPAESLVVEGLSSLLRLSPRSRQLSVKGSDQGLGFDKPDLEICVSTSKKSSQRCLLIGTQAAVVKGSYAKWKDESEYFLVNSNFLDAFDKTLYSLRKKQIFDLSGKEITEIQFRSEEKERFLKHQGQNWVLLKPKEMNLSAHSAEALTTLLSGLYVKEFLDQEPWTDPKFGLASSQKTIRIVFNDQSEQTLIWGSEAPGFDAYYALGPEGKTLLLVSRGKVSQAADKFTSFS